MAKSNYASCLRETLRHEGGYANNPADPGGETMYGIIKETAKDHGYTGPMKSIPMSVVESIYAQSYWNTPYYKGDTLAPGVDLAVFDFGVNSGPSRAGKFLAAAAGGSDEETINKLCDARLAFLKALSTWKTFGNGWTSRVASVRAKSLSMAKAGAPSAPVVPAPVPPPAPSPAPSPAPLPAPKAPPIPAPKKLLAGLSAAIGMWLMYSVKIAVGIGAASLLTYIIYKIYQSRKT